MSAYGRHTLHVLSHTSLLEECVPCDSAGGDSETSTWFSPTPRPVHVPFAFAALGLYSFAVINVSLWHDCGLHCVSPSELGGGLGVPLDYLLGWV